ncbi:protein of unknown function [Halolactibacillus halophilus]|uniref:GTPase n=1 Tax=Halolactibacillus halophilus TaxID=306540 RepID=A0A1I5SF02_9BACI|nr:GTPase [Halolactibacillus halophilus]GEM02557.1 GTPase [Halolactibacillus halophilus]SFP69301.1 protein of unknown function [Halolactibacillus halophilus]
MERGNVLVIGNSGVGKSTLINTVLGSEVAESGFGSTGTTKELKIYESKEIPFRVIDTVGFEPSFGKQLMAINSVKKWSKSSIKDNTKINMIWFCVDGTSRKLFFKTIKNLAKATTMWKSVPIVVVITKSYSKPERTENIAMVEEVFSDMEKFNENLKAIVPVVASTYTINETTFVPPEGIVELIDISNQLMPEGIKAGDNDVYNFKLRRKMALAQSIVGFSVTSAATVGAVPIPFADALILGPIELAEIKGLAQLYEINRHKDSSPFVDSIIEIGTVGAAAKLAISSIKAIPGLNIAASVVNAVVAGSIVAAIGEGSIYVFEKIYKGEKTVEDIEWMKKVMENKLSSQFIENVGVILGKIDKNATPRDIAKMVNTIFVSMIKTK